MCRFLTSVLNTLPKGLLVVIYATELRVFNAHSASVYAPRAPMRMGDVVDKSSVFIWFLA